MNEQTISIFGDKILFEILNEIKIFSKYKVKFFENYNKYLEEKNKGIIIFFLNNNNTNLYKNIIEKNFSILTIFFFSSCAPTVTQPVEPPKPEPISMPSGWDDSVIDKIKAGESIKKVLAVLDFEGNDKLKGKFDLKMSGLLK